MSASIHTLLRPVRLGYAGEWFQFQRELSRPANLQTAVLPGAAPESPRMVTIE
jgi:hypothetical protein